MEIKKLKLSWSGGRGDSNYVTVPRDIYLQLTLALLIRRVQWKSIYEQLTSFYELENYQSESL